MTKRPRTIDPLTRTSAWLADIDDWDATDAEVFVVAVARTTEVSTSLDHRAAERSA